MVSNVLISLEFRNWNSVALSNLLQRVKIIFSKLKLLTHRKLTVMTPSFTSPNNVPIALESFEDLREYEFKTENTTLAPSWMRTNEESFNVNASYEFDQAK